MGGGLGPEEWVGAVVPAVDEGADLGVEFVDGAEGAAADGLAFDDAEPDLDEVEPGRGGRGEVHVHALVGLEPAADLDALVRGVVVHHQVQFTLGIGLGDLFEEAQELLMPVPRLTGRGEVAGGDLQRGEQRGGAVPHIVVAAPLGQPGLQRQDRRAAIQSLDLRLLVDTHSTTAFWQRWRVPGAITGCSRGARRRSSSPPTRSWSPRVTDVVGLYLAPPPNS